MTGSSYRFRASLVGTLAVISVWAGAHCSSGTQGTPGPGDGSAAASGGSGGSSGAAASGSGSAASGASPGSGGGGSGSQSTGSGSGSSSGIGAAGSDDGGAAPTPEAGDDGASAPGDAGLAVIDGSPRGCMPRPNPNATRGAECDYLQQSIDFEDHFGYPSPAGSIKVTNFGTALGPYAINNCGPYCYGKNFTINVDIVGGGTQAQEQGEVIFEFPATGAGLPIATAVGRDSLAWIILDGPTMPPFMIKGQLVIETTTGIVTANDSKALAYHDWLMWQSAEFKYFGLKAASFSAAPNNVTGIGFRIIGPPNLPKGQEWHGVAYIDHLQIRSAGGPNNPTDAGPYPFGL